MVSIHGRGRLVVFAAATALLTLPPGVGLAQGQPPVSPANGSGQTSLATVPRLLRYSGRLHDATGQPLTGTMSITFSLYSRYEGGAPEWSESQIVELDQDGRYVVLLGYGTQDGIPLHLFTTDQERWIGAQAAGLAEEPRTLVVSVAYAIKAQDAETLGGKPASAYLLASGSDGARSPSATKDEISAAAAPAGGGGGMDFSARTLTATIEDAPGLLLETRTGPPMVIRSPAVVSNLNADLLDGFDSAAFPRLAVANTFTANQTINGLLTATAGQFTGVSATTASDGGTAVRGQSTITTGQGFGVSGTTSASVNLSAGVYGGATHPTAFTHGVFGESLGVGAAIRGIGRNATSGIGVEGLTQGSSGIAMFAQVPASTGNGIGIFASVNSATATPGLFQNNGGGNLIVGTTSGAEKFRVDGLGAVYATAYRDLATGAPLPNGDITAVGAGTGLLGGGAAGDVSISLDTAYTDARYAPVAHTHVVSDVAGAATLGANTFTGNQVVNGGVSATSVSAGSVSTPEARIDRTAAGDAVTINHGGSSGSALRASSSYFGHPTIWSQHLGTTSGNAIRGEGATAGVVGIGKGTGGTEVEGVFGVTIGDGAATNAGVRGRSEVLNGVGGLFENSAGGPLLIGRVGFEERFRVDNAGAIYAAAYKDLAGNPIPSGTGDITAVAADTGLAGGGTAGDVTLALDTAFTDARYATLVHGHDVAQITNAATLAANTFNGNQTVTGNVTASGNVSGSTATFTSFNGQSALIQNGLTARLPASASGGSAIVGQAFPTSGGITGVTGAVASSQGTGVFADAYSTTGSTIGLYAKAASPSGTSAVFENMAGGNLLRGSVNGTEKFRVDGTGAVYATSYRDLAGNPIPTGTGDITSVGAGSGLIGGGASGDVSLALDTAFTDARYALLGHGHSVGEVAGAATLGANSFAGNQAVTGDVSATGALTAKAAALSGGNATEVLFVNQTGTGFAARFQGTTDSQLLQVNQAGSGGAVIGVASGGGFGVQGFATATNGIGVIGSSSAASGNARGVWGTVQSPSGIAGLFDNSSGGTLLSGRVAGAEKFRVDGTGAVYAASYRDLAGNPIASGTGDITAVTVGTGLTGGGLSGDVTVALNTAFTDSRYALLSHGHSVDQISGAARLAANSFTGAQTINNTLFVTGDGVNQSAFTSNNFIENSIAVRGNASSTSGRGIYGEAQTGVQGVSATTGGRGVFGWTTNASGAGRGVSGEAGGDAGVGVSGLAYSSSGQTRGVAGTASSPDGVGVDGVALSTTGQATGVRGRTNSAGAGVQGIASGPGVAGIFDNPAGGNLLLGRAGTGLAHVFRVDGSGRGFFNNGTQVGGADFAESVAVTGDRESYEPGDVLVIDPTARRAMQKSSSTYSTTVAGIYSTKPGILANPYGMDDPRLASEVPLAVIGIVPCKVSTENGAVAAGDLLVTSSTPGHAMKGTDRWRMLGAVVGKALEPLKSGTGVILVLVTLQ